MIHNICRLTNSKAADCISVALHLLDRFHICDAEIIIGSALVDTEKKLIGVDGVRVSIKSVKLCSATLEPTDSTLVRCLDVCVGGGVFHTLVKRHSDSGAKVGLNTH